jgi:hypothetical protein
VVVAVIPLYGGVAGLPDGVVVFVVIAVKESPADFIISRGFFLKLLMMDPARSRRMTTKTTAKKTTTTATKTTPSPFGDTPP